MNKSAIMTGIILVFAGIGILLVKNHLPIPEITIESLLLKYRHLSIIAVLLIFVGWYWFSRLFFYSLMATVFSFLVLTGVFFYTNQRLDTPKTLDYLVTEKFERSVHYTSDTAKSMSSSSATDLCLKGVHQASGRICRFCVSQGGFYQPTYKKIDLTTKKYWVHTIEGKGTFNLRWRKKIIGVFEKPVKN